LLDCRVKALRQKIFKETHKDKTVKMAIHALLMEWQSSD
jgi:hypothetical protein